MQQPISYRNAEQHIERKLGFYSHLAIYLLVNSGLILLNLLQTPGHTWSVFPLFGWGIGLLFHAIRVFLRDPASDWKQRMIARELEKYQHRQHD